MSYQPSGEVVGQLLRVAISEHLDHGMNNQRLLGREETSVLWSGVGRFTAL